MSDEKKAKLGLIEERLVEGEQIIVQADIHWGIFWKSAAILVLSLIFFIFVATELGVLLLVVAGLSGLYAAALKSILILIITDKRVLVRYGILQMDVVDLHFDKLESVELERMPPGMIMGYSRVAILGTGNRYISIPYVANGPDIRKAYNEMTLNKK